MELRVLGPVELILDGEPINLGVRRHRLVLAVLALEVNNPVTTERLMELVWPGGAPSTARGMIHSYVSSLRAVLANTGARRAGMWIERDPQGYLLRCDPACIDVHTFRGLLADARRAACDEERLALLGRAVGLWHGPALAGLASEGAVGWLCASLEEARRTALEDLIEVRLRLGRHVGLVEEVLAAAGEHAHRPRLIGGLMRALNAAGRTGEALEIYQRFQRDLRDELGLDPPKEVAELQVAILRNPGAADQAVLRGPGEGGSGSGEGGGAPGGAAARASLAPKPAQLPADLASFTGRTAELARVLALPPACGQSPILCAISGMPGVGKTALAVHAGHLLAPDFPDGQLFLDLHGFTTGAPALEPADALDRVLRALGVPGDTIPGHTDERAALMRTLLSRRRVLMVLDNAATEEQVRPLLPGSPTCMVMITSRRRLAGLDDAHDVPLDVLAPQEAADLFTGITPSAAEAGDVAEVVALCGRLPLAIRIAAARLRQRPTWTVRDLSARLGNLRLEELQLGERSVAAALSLSYQGLPPQTRRVFRLLALHPGPDFTVHAAAALCDTTLLDASTQLQTLLDATMAEEPHPGRHRFHDLVRDYARLRVSDEEDLDTRQAALARLRRHYVSTASAALQACYPADARHRAQVAPPDGPAPAFPDAARAMAWFAAELPNLLATAENDRSAHVIQLSATLHPHLRARGHLRQARLLHTQALEAARLTGDAAGELQAINDLGDIHHLEGRNQQAEGAYEQALRLARSIGDSGAEILALVGLGYQHRLHGRFEHAAAHFEQATTLARTAGHRLGELHAAHGLGSVAYYLGQNQDAAAHFAHALRVSRDLGHRPGELSALVGLAYVHRDQGRHDPAAQCYEQVLDIARETGSRSGELSALWGLGGVHRGQGHHRRAADSYQRALDIAADIGDRNGRFEALHGLGRIHTATGHPRQALRELQTALELAQELDQPEDQARAHDGLGHACRLLGHHEQARRHWSQALGLLDDLGLARIEEVCALAVRRELDDLSTSTA